MPLSLGGMSEVCKARDTRLDRTVAVEVLPEHIAKRDDIQQRFEREARACVDQTEKGFATWQALADRVIIRAAGA